MERKTLLKEQYQDFLRTEKTLLWDIHNCLLKAGAPAAEVGHVQEAINRLEELFLLVVVGEFNSGKSAFINALIEENVLAVGPTPTTDMINLVKYGEERSTRIVDKLKVTKFPLELLKNVNIVDTPGTNSLLREHDELTLNFIPQADFVVFVMSADRPFTDSEREFLELISLKWKRKLLFLLNKIDIVDARDLPKIIAYLRREGTNILSLEPVIFPASVKLASEGKRTHNAELLAQSRFPELERYIAEALNEKERVRLKLSNPLYTAQPVCHGVAAALQEKLRVIAADLQQLQQIEKQLSYTQADLKESYTRFILQVENILLDLRNRAYDFVDAFLQVDNIWNIASKDKAARQFHEKVVKDASEQIEAVLTKAADWMVQKSMKSWDDTLTYYKQQFQREGQREKLIGATGGQFAYDRQKIYQNVIQEARAKISAFDFHKESQQILTTFQEGMFNFAATEVGAIGVGSLLVLAFQTLFLDITGLVASGVLVTAGFFILPRKRRQAKEAFNARISELIADLKQTIAQEFDDYMHVTFEQIKDTISPFDRFCRVERDELEAAHNELLTLTKKLDALQDDIQHYLAAQ